MMSELWAIAQVILIDISLAADNAVVVGLAAAGLPQEQRAKAILYGIAAATVLRIVFALFTTQLLQIVGLLAAGGILLLWVSWKMAREIHRNRQQRLAEAAAIETLADPDEAHGKPAPKSMRDAMTQIIVADISMSLDNVLAVAGAAREHPWILVFGLALSVALMGAAASFIARLLQRHHWLAYVGLAIILYVSLSMIWEGGHEIWAATNGGAHP